MNQTTQVQTDQGMEKVGWAGGVGRKSWEEKPVRLLLLNILFCHGNDKRQGLSGHRCDEVTLKGLVLLCLGEERLPGSVVGAVLFHFGRKVFSDQETSKPRGNSGPARKERC